MVGSPLLFALVDKHTRPPSSIAAFSKVLVLSCRFVLLLGTLALGDPVLILVFPNLIFRSRAKRTPFPVPVAVGCLLVADPG